MADLSATLAKLSLPPEEIAGRTKLSLARVAALMRGEPATATELRALMNGLRLPARTFSRAGFVTDTAASTVRFRNTRTKAEYDPTNERIAGFVDAALKLLPQRQSPPEWLEGLWEFPHSSADHADQLAQRFRVMLYPEQEDEPAIGLPQRLNALGGVLVNQLVNSKFEGASLVAAGYIFIFVAPRFPARMLFTLGHELGHVLAHHASEQPHYDLAGDVGRFKNRDEAFADNFSATFLLPARAVGIVLSAIRQNYVVRSDAVGDVEILTLSRFFGVSFEVAARRCERLGLLPPGGASSLSEYVKKEFGSAERRASQAKLPERQSISLDRISPVLIDAASREISSGEVSPSWVAERLGVSVDQLQKARAGLIGRSIAH